MIVWSRGLCYVPLQRVMYSGWGISLFSFTLHVCVLSHLCHMWLFVTLWTVAHQAPLSMGFSRQENWSGLPFPSPGDLPNPLALPLVPSGKPNFTWNPENQRLIQRRFCKELDETMIVGIIWKTAYCKSTIFNSVFGKRFYKRPESK